MKMLKRMVTMVLVLVVLLSVVAIPAHATDYSFWEARFRVLPVISNGSGRTLVVKAVQRFLYFFPQTASRIRNAGGIDGSFGSTTTWAVKEFQKDWFGEPAGDDDIDGVVGPDTWGAIPYYLEQLSSVYLLSYAREYDMYFIYVTNTYEDYYTYDGNDEEMWFFTR